MPTCCSVTGLSSSPGRPGEEDRLLDSSDQHGIAPSDLALVVLTHGHTDHAGSVNAVVRAGVPIAIGADDAGLLERGVNEQLPITGFPGTYPHAIEQ